MSAAERPRRSQKVAYKAASSDEYEGEPEEKVCLDSRAVLIHRARQMLSWLSCKMRIVIESFNEHVMSDGIGGRILGAFIHNIASQMDPCSRSSCAASSILVSPQG